MSDISSLLKNCFEGNYHQVKEIANRLISKRIVANIQEQKKSLVQDLVTSAKTSTESFSEYIPITELQSYLDENGRYKGEDLSEYGFNFKPGDMIPVGERYSAALTLQWALNEKARLMEDATPVRPLSTIASEIYDDWKNVNYGAKP